MINFFKKLTQLFLNIIAWPVNLITIILSGFARFSSFGLNNGSMYQTIASFVFGFSIIMFFAQLVGVFLKKIPLLGKIINLIFIISSFLLISLVTYLFGVGFQTYHWTFEYTGEQRSHSLFAGFGFVACIVTTLLYVIFIILWFASLLTKTKQFFHKDSK